MALVTTSILRSRAVAALASPHGVDRYLEQVNPMWAAHDVRARVVAVTRETDADPARSGRHRSPSSPPAPGADTAPASTSRSASTCRARPAG